MDKETWILQILEGYYFLNFIKEIFLKKCVPTQSYNECEKEEENECSSEARCIDLVGFLKIYLRFI